MEFAISLLVVLTLCLAFVAALVTLPTAIILLSFGTGGGGRLGFVFRDLARHPERWVVVNAYFARHTCLVHKTLNVAVTTDRPAGWVLVCRDYLDNSPYDRWVIAWAVSRWLRANGIVELRVASEGTDIPARPTPSV